MSLLDVNGIECRYGDTVVAADVTLRVNKGAVVGLLGPSGCGKTTVLRAIAGFQPLQQGEIRLDGRVISSPGFTLAPEKRHLGMVFQDYSLFPHMDVGDNICFGLRGLGRAERGRLAEEMLETVGLAGFCKRFPHELSGGQQQRVALARALAPKPDLLLLDEPFSSLDVELREHLSVEVREILKHRGTTAILVTHDQHEAFAMCEMVGVMNHGRILQWDTPYQLYHEPNHRFVADFIGQGEFLTATVLADNRLETELGIVRCRRQVQWPAGTQVEVLFRPDDILPEPESPLRTVVIDKAFKGAETLYTLRLETGATVVSLFPSHHNHEIGERVGIRIDAEHVVAFPIETAATAHTEAL
ncbi:MAG: ABC transporter ATP-binding protein [Chromatiales bacterium]|nr:ABC transporter ATP-binding protein [Chromatiales bacterium]